MKKSRLRLLFWIALGLLLPQPGMAAGKLGVLSWKPYVFEASGGKVEAELGTLAVPLRRGRPESGALDLAAVRFRSTAKQPGPPLVYLAGGPGGSALDTARGARFPLLMALREAADVVVLDQRGTGLSTPFTIDCRESWFYPVDRPGDREEMLALARSHSRSCVEFLARSGVDLAAYNNDESADDLEDLRKALGVPRVSLWGVSYGTQLALHALRRHPDSFHRAILASVEGPDHTLRSPRDVQLQLEEIDRLIRQDPAARAAVPDFLGLLRSLLDRLEKQPVTVEVFDRPADRKAQAQAGRFELQMMTARALGSLEGIRGLPATFHAMSRGDFSKLGEYVYRRRKGWLGSALPYAVNCASGVSPERLRRIREEEKGALLGRAMDFPFPEICEGWSVPDLGPGFRAPVRSPVPVLLLGGTLDARTPVGNMAEVAAGLPNAAQVVVEGGGHGDDLLLASPEIQRLMLAFLRGTPPARQRIALAPLRFEPPYLNSSSSKVP